VLVERIAVGTCDAADGLLEVWVVERLDFAAVAADEVVVVFATGVGGLEASDAASEVDSVHELYVGELVECAVDACQPDGATLGAELVEELLRGEAAALRAEVGDDRLAGAAQASAGATELLSRVVFPARLARGSH
jgi:hypothetical protein